jgi:hypothetical protein
MRPSVSRVVARYIGAKLVRRTIKLHGGSHKVELTPQQLAAISLMPGGQGREYNHDYSKGTLTGVYWSKRGGYIDALNRKIYPALKAAGFRQVDTSASNTPDGSVFTSGTLYKDSEGNTIRSSSRTGVTKYDNSYDFSLIFKDPPVLMSAEMDEVRDKTREREDRKAIRARQDELAAGVLRAVKDVKQDKEAGTVGKISTRAFPPWAKGVRVKEADLWIWPGNGWVRARMWWTKRVLKGDKDREIEVRASYDPDDAQDLIRAIGEVLRKLKKRRRPKWFPVS